MEDSIEVCVVEIFDLVFRTLAFTMLSDGSWRSAIEVRVLSKVEDGWLLKLF